VCRRLAAYVPPTIRSAVAMSSARGSLGGSESLDGLSSSASSGDTTEPRGDSTVSIIIQSRQIGM